MNMINSSLRDSGHSTDKWCYACETTQEIYNSLLHTAINEQPTYLWYGQRTNIHDFRVWGCEVFCKNYLRTNDEDKSTRGYFMGYTATRVLTTWWDPETGKIKLTSSCKFNEINYNDPVGDRTPGIKLQNNIRISRDKLKYETIDTSDIPFIDSAIKTYKIKLPKKGTPLGIKLQY